MINLLAGIAIAATGVLRMQSAPKVQTSLLLRRTRFWAPCNLSIVMTKPSFPRSAALALVSGAPLFGSASGDTRYHGSCVSAMVEDRQLGSYDLDWRAERRLTDLNASIYNGIHRTGILIGRHIDEAKMVLGTSEACNSSHGRYGLVCDIYSVFFDYGTSLGSLRSLQVYTDENGIVIKTEIVTL